MRKTNLENRRLTESAYREILQSKKTSITISIFSVRRARYSDWIINMKIYTVCPKSCWHLVKVIN